ncbi:SecY-interacting protein Syd [Sodalis-like endosymbiont of Proechinophthirus fluctus]|uniref:SecY-interacting protein Syd n=1 Tax=Sodalis-like endosymbiont of Proechinophthirus fluctus TaxID=1462730 RepID=UPI0034E95100
MVAAFEGKPIELVQVWGESDFVRVQKNLIGHLLMPTASAPDTRRHLLARLRLN